LPKQASIVILLQILVSVGSISVYQLSTLVTKITINFAALLLLIWLLSGCSDSSEGFGSGRFGIKDSETPEYALTNFFNHLYNDDNLDGVIAFSSTNMIKVIKAYRTNVNVQRHVMNLRYDKHSVSIRPQIDKRVGIGRTEFATQTRLTVFFTGYFFDDRKEDFRTVDLVRVYGQWKVDRIHPDKFS
jgi:hypothetical protein